MFRQSLQVSLGWTHKMATTSAWATKIHFGFNIVMGCSALNCTSWSWIKSFSRCPASEAVGGYTRSWEGTQLRHWPQPSQGTSYSIWCHAQYVNWGESWLQGLLLGNRMALFGWWWISNCLSFVCLLFSWVLLLSYFFSSFYYNFLLFLF